jgi:hypothetical protein
MEALAAWGIAVERESDAPIWTKNLGTKLEDFTIHLSPEPKRIAVVCRAFVDLATRCGLAISAIQPPAERRVLHLVVTSGDIAAVSEYMHKLVLPLQCLLVKGSVVERPR